MYRDDLINSKSGEDGNWVLDFKKDRFKRFDSLPMPVWKRVKLDGFEFPEYREYCREYIENQVSRDGIKIRNIRHGIGTDEYFKQYMNVTEPFGVGEKFLTFGEALNNTGVLIKTEMNAICDDILRVKYSLDAVNPLVIDHNIIVAGENSKITILFDYSTSAGNEVKTLHNGVTKVYAQRGSEVNIIKVQRMDKNAFHFDSNIAFLEGDAKINWISIEIGASLSATSFINNLEGIASQADIKSVYLGDEESRLDLDYTMNHIGMRSQSNIETRGALKDKSRKVFRGNLHFKKGARRSKGSEEEHVLLLSPTAKSDSIPVLFCAEDDVEGNHAASAGQIDGEKLFYLMSRGFDEREAKKLIVEASFRPILDKIPATDIRDAIEENIHRRLVYA